ncbi:MAG: biotin--[acetyl-CoA-carboxylase] ligase [Thermoplasmatota archaeon]
MTWHIERLETCQSTQDEATARAQSGAPHGTVVVATTMEDGRGQHGRAWHAPEGGLYLSLVLRDTDPAFLTLALGNAVADVLEVAGAEPRMKWVNDVWVEGKKIAGILVEAESTGAEVDFITAGIGINVNGSAKEWPQPFQDQAVTLEDVLGAESCMEDLESYLLESIEDWLGRLARPDEVIAAWRARDGLVGQQVGFDPDGDFCTKIVGQVLGIDDQGRLRLATDDGEQVFDNGSVFLQESRQMP